MKAFGLLGSFVLVTALCLVVCNYYQRPLDYTIMMVACGWFVIGNMALAMFFTRGYGVKGTSTVAGMPVVLAVLIIAAAGLIAYLLHAATYEIHNLHSDTIANIKAFGWSAASGIVVAVCHWYGYCRTEYWRLSEHEFRKACRTEKVGRGEEDALIAQLRERRLM